MPQRLQPLDQLRADFVNRHSGLLSDLLAQYTRFVVESPPLGERQMPERVQHLLRMLRVTGRSFLDERSALVQATGSTRDEVLAVLMSDAEAWIREHGPAQKKWMAPFKELEITPAKR